MCIVNHTRRFIFVHVPKSAGTTVSEVLSRLTTYRDQEIGATAFGQAINRPYAQRFGLRKHCTASELVDVVGESTWREYFTFGFIRNPYARSYSTYTFLKRWREWEGSDVMDSFPSFEAFVSSDFFERPGPDEILEPQLHWLGSAGGDEALDVDAVFRVETMEVSMLSLWDRLCPEAPLDPATDIPVSNSSSAPGAWRANVSSAPLRARIEARYSADFEALGYELLR